MAYEFSTRAIHGASVTTGNVTSVVEPIYQTSTFGQEAIGGSPDYCYSRTGNPSRTSLEAALAQLEDARHGLAFASGMAAIVNVLNCLSTGDHVVACNDLYGGAYRVFTKLFTKFGIEFTFVNATDAAAVQAAVRPATRIIWLETPSNPLLRVTDIEACAAIARAAGAWTVVDNTFATSYLQRPLDLGADIVVHSTTKYANGHSDALGGALLTNSDELHDQLRFFQNAAGAVPGPQDCFLIQRGLKTLGLRMERHCATARCVAAYLARHPAVETVHFPGLATHPQHALAARQQRDFGGVVSFTLAGGASAVRRFGTQLKLWTLAESLGGVKSLWCHPATMTHAAVEPDVRRRNGLGDGLVRLSAGLEDAGDLVADLEQALDALSTSSVAVPGAVEVVQ